MLLSIVSTSAISSSAISSSVISMVTTPGLPQYGSAVVVGLISLLSLKEVLSASKYWNRRLNNSFNLPIIPLLCSFAAIVVFKVATILWDYYFSLLLLLKLPALFWKKVFFHLIFFITFSLLPVVSML